MFSKIFRVGSRLSPLALKQVNEAEGLLRAFAPGARFDVVGFETPGDRDKQTPLSEVEGTDFFTRDIDQALLEGKIDIAVHSAKDVPEPLPAGLVVAALTKALDSTDALVSKKNLGIDELKKGAKIGASSRRRRQQLKNYRRDFDVVDVRGTIAERLSYLDHSGLDALIVASCALMRLGFADRITQRLSPDVFPPHPLQGRLALVARAGDRATIDFFKDLLSLR